ncbi:MAG: type II secretion system minor pseudopilin GspK [Burkholderiaceae bacterium]
MQTHALPCRTPSTRQGGAALLMAMLTVALVATLAVGAQWQQWRALQIESSERSRVQAGWILNGALGWARLILREDGRTGGADTLGEPWSIPLAESRLSTFLAVDRDHAEQADDIFLSGGITDVQARMNVMNLVVAGKLSEPDMKAFRRLFEQRGIDESELDSMAANLLLAVSGSSDSGADRPAPLLPRRVAQLRWLGLSQATLDALAPFIAVLPIHVPLNLNTAGPEVIAASIDEMQLGDARRLVAERDRRPYQNLAQASQVLSAGANPLNSGQFSVSTRFFEVRGRLRIGQMVVEERSMVLRNGTDVTVLWRERTAIEGTHVAQSAWSPVVVAQARRDGVLSASADMGLHTIRR